MFSLCFPACLDSRATIFWDHMTISQFCPPPLQMCSSPHGAASPAQSRLAPWRPPALPRPPGRATTSATGQVNPGLKVHRSQEAEHWHMGHMASMAETCRLRGTNRRWIHVLLCFSVLFVLRDGLVFLSGINRQWKTRQSQSSRSNTVCSIKTWLWLLAGDDLIKYFSIQKISAELRVVFVFYGPRKSQTIVGQTQKAIWNAQEDKVESRPAWNERPLWNQNAGTDYLWLKKCFFYPVHSYRYAVKGERTFVNDNTGEPIECSVNCVKPCVFQVIWVWSLYVCLCSVTEETFIHSRVVLVIPPLVWVPVAPHLKCSKRDL